MKLFWATLVACLLTLALNVATLLVLRSTPKPPSLAGYVRRGELGMGAPAIRLQAWKAIRKLARDTGVSVVSEVLVSQRTDGDLARLTYYVKFSKPDGTNVRSEYVLVTLNRSLWSVTQMAPGINPADAN